jgi:hypothetical protein
MNYESRIDTRESRIENRKSGMSNDEAPAILRFETLRALVDYDYEQENAIYRKMGEVV